MSPADIINPLNYTIMDEYQKEFIIKCLERHPEKYYEIACEVATAMKDECPVLIEDYLECCCNGLSPIEILKKFHGVNPSEYEYMIYEGYDWEGMNQPDVDTWAREMVKDNLELCKTSDIEEWDEEKFHAFMWETYCIADGSFMRNYYKDYDVYPYNGTATQRISQFKRRWGVYVNSTEKVTYDVDLGNGNYIYRIEFDNCRFGYPDGTAYVSMCSRGEPLTTEEAFRTLPKSDPGTYKEWCARNLRDLDSKSYTLYKREANLWKLVLTIFPDEKARKELAIVFP